ncbi:hypothetical protein AGDE_16798 [Angomonas deanei]|uniref:Uncharacterized protein n=1 Tax=Angomonas deanei TaxID=59799 RepID=A0A7G2CK65_9TRYP|nr:hypothetical protein AGDE_16798 [Angomonas deanei]CAD2219467.1 hypothetical protein, conserved [Angomonas deanei]|eukprot:EPY16174.1 hypothetical protein AGDE_16798 [Angomonas deanei]
MDEMRQPDYIHDKRYGVFSNERNVAKSRRGLPHITPMYRTHMNLWDSDTDASNNRFFRSYVFGQRELHLLLGRPHGFEADLNTAGQQGYSNYELNTDMRYKGAPRSAMTNLHFEREWAQTLYRNSGNKEASALNNPRSPFTEEILGNELLNVRDIKSLEHCQAWFDRLQYLIKLHYDAVGEIGPFRSRHTQHVHTFFMAFYDALSSFDFQDHYLFEHFHQCRPKALEDLFGIFIEMEANYVHHDYCPRCSLSLKETRYCGEGEPDTPFRKHRGRWAPHQKWGREWYDVVVRRAEALWYRSTEDPYFGLQEHTQRQAEALLTVYVRTKQRGKAIDFLHQLRGSREFLLGRITITPAMQQAYETLLDETPHPHLLTNAYQHEEGVSQYTQDRQAVPLSPVQVRLDLEQQKWRRQQKEEGVVRVPPAGWTVDTSTIVPYKIDPKTRHITNWREVKKGIEESFLKTGLPEEAYTSLELKELLALRHGIASRGARRAALESQLRYGKGKKKKSRR